MQKPEFECVGCGDTGINSRGGPCGPCLARGRTPLQNSIKRAIGSVFRSAEAENRLPYKHEIIRAVDWTYTARTTYAAGYRDEHGGMSMIGGPTQNMDDLLELGGLEDTQETLYIVKFTKADFGEEPEFEPVARWKGNRWVFKP